MCGRFAVVANLKRWHHTCIDLELNVSDHLSIKVEMGGNLTSDHDHSRPADILLPLGKPAAFDISVTLITAKPQNRFSSGIVRWGSHLVHRRAKAYN